MTSEFSNEWKVLRRVLRYAVIFCCALAVLGCVLSGIYVVNTQETGVRFRFGKVATPSVPPGIHYRLPWPIDKVTKVRTKEVKRVQAGFGADPDDLAIMEQSMEMRLNDMQGGTYVVPYCITGDKNIIHLKVIINYQIADPPVHYLLEHRESPDTLARGILFMAAQSSIIQVASKHDVDFLLTTGKPQVQSEILENLKAFEEAHPMGLRVLSVELKNTRPPGQVAAAFMDVINAYEEKSTAIHDAESYSKRLSNDAQGQVARIMTEAQGYKDQRVKEAQGEAERFSLLAEEYKKQPILTEERLRLDAVGEILAKAKVYLVGEEDGDDLVHLKIQP